MLQGQGRYCIAFTVGSVMAQLKVLMHLNCPTSFFSCSLDIWKHTEDPSLCHPCLSLSLCDDPKVFQQRKACKAEDHLSALGRPCSLSLRAAFLPPRRFRSGGLAHLQQLCRVAVWGRHAGLHADGGELHQARGGTQHRGHALQRPLWAVPRWLHSAVHVCKWCGCKWLQLLCPLPRAWFGAMVKGTRTACTHGQNMQVWKQTEGETSGFQMFSTGTFAGNKQL